LQIEQIKIIGSIAFRQSTRNENELFLSLRNNAKVTVSDLKDTPQASPCIAAIIHALNNSLYSNSVFSRLIGDCILTRKNDDEFLSVLLRDASGVVL